MERGGNGGESWSERRAEEIWRAREAFDAAIGEVYVQVLFVGASCATFEVSGLEGAWRKETGSDGDSVLLSTKAISGASHYTQRFTLSLGAFGAGEWVQACVALSSEVSIVHDASEPARWMVRARDCLISRERMEAAGAESLGLSRREYGEVVVWAEILGRCAPLWQEGNDDWAHIRGYVDALRGVHQEALREVGERCEAGESEGIVVAQGVKVEWEETARDDDEVQLWLECAAKSGFPRFGQEVIVDVPARQGSMRAEHQGMWTLASVALSEDCRIVADEYLVSLSITLADGQDVELEGRREINLDGFGLAPHEAEAIQAWRKAL